MNRPPTSPRCTARHPWSTLAVAAVAWIGLSYFAPGLHGSGIGSLLADDDSTGLLLETGVAAIILATLILTHRRFSRSLFARSKQLGFYTLPVILAVLLPFHYTMALPLPVYMLWISVSVLWQDYLTFGLLQSYARERLPRWVTAVVVAAMFYLGHALFLPERFAPTHLVAALGILGLGLIFSLTRSWAGSLHPLLALHLAFYFLFA